MPKEGSPAQMRIPSELRGQFVTIHTGKSDVEQQDIRLIPTRV